MKKICFLIGNLNNSGGTERVCSIIANELSRNNYNVSINSIIEGDKPFFALDNKVETFSLHAEIGNTRPIFLTPFIIYKLRKFLMKEKVDILIVVESMSVLFSLPAVSRLPVKHICWEHFNFKSDLGKAGRRLSRQLAARYCDSVVTLTDRDKEYWLKGTKHKSQILSIPNPSPFPPQYFMKQKENKTVLAVGRLSAQKGFDLLLEAWLYVINQNPDWNLIIVGEGSDRKMLENFIDLNNLSDSVKLVGNTSDISSYYKKADIFCLSSRFEGFPMVLLETLSFGIPTVSFDCDTGPAEILEGTGSILVNPNDVKGLADGIVKMMQDSSERMAITNKCLKKSELYQPSVILSKWLQLLEK